MKIDIHTLIFILGITHLLQVSVFLQQNAVNKNVRGTGWWLLWILAEIAGFACLLLRGVTPLQYPFIIAQNLLLVGGVVFLYIGILRFFEKKENLTAILTGLAVYLAGFLYFLFVKDDIDARGAVISVALATVALASARALLANRSRALSVTVKSLAAIFAVHGAVHLWRAGRLLVAGAGPDLFAPTFLNVVTYLDAILAGLAWTFGLVLLVNQRLSGELLETNKELELVFDASPDAVLLSAVKTGRIERVNAGFTAIAGYSREEAQGKTVGEIGLWKKPVERDRFVRELLAKGVVSNFETGFRRKDGTRIEGLVSGRLIVLKGVQHLISVTRDITRIKQEGAERAELKEKLLHSQKMELVGRLAGGVAHDFNNLLTAISCNAAFLLKELPEPDARRAEAEDILAASARAAKLTSQLLAFSRKQILNPQVIDLNASVAGVSKMLKRLIDEEVQIQTKFAAQACWTKVDTGQIDQVLVNLAVNARDAMPKGGVLTLETEILTPDANFSLRYPDLPTGPLVCLTVRDTGSGLTAEARQHLFEPFFTTKEKGKGTGLGLSTVFGIIKQSGGEIEVESEPNKETAFRMYFPCVDSPVSDIDKDKDTLRRGSETILLVEDEDMLRRLGERVLKADGYTVITAADGKAALEAVQRHGKPVDLLVTDVVMPGMSGRELALEMSKRKLAHRTLYMSGYTDEAISDHGVLEEGIAFIYKPFSPDALSKKLREVLDGPADQAKA